MSQEVQLCEIIAQLTPPELLELVSRDKTLGPRIVEHAISSIPGRCERCAPKLALLKEAVYANTSPSEKEEYLRSGREKFSHSTQQLVTLT